MCEGVFTWRRLVSAVPESSAGPPSWPSPPRVGDASLPVLCAGPPGSFSFAHDASGAAEKREVQSEVPQEFKKKTRYKTPPPKKNTSINLPQPQSL